MKLLMETARHHALNHKMWKAAPDGRCRTHLMKWKGIRVNVSLRTDEGDLFVLHEVFGWGAYAIPGDLSKQIREAGEDAVFVDLGANVGLVTLYYAGLFPKARFVCVEPDPDNITLLRRNVQALGSRVHVIEGAISDVSGWAEWNAHAPAWARHLDPDSQGVRVRTYTVPEILAEASVLHVALLKVDVEGAEEKVFLDPSLWLGQVDAVIIELHSDLAVERFVAAARASHMETILQPSPGAEHSMPLAIRLSSPSF